jgi:Fic family protein
MAIKPAGYQWLKEHFNLKQFQLTHCSFIGTNPSIELTSKGNIEQVYGRKYAPAEDTPMLHLEFSLKYDDLNLDLLNTLFRKISLREVVDYIESAPSGKYARKLGFLYEFLTHKSLTLNTTIKGNYIDLLEQDRYITGTKKTNSRWRVNDNLPGTPDFCPIIRRTKILSEILDLDIPKKIEQLKNDFSPAIFNRAIHYLYNKETRSSFEIEKEQPSAARLEKFINLLMKAGTEQPGQLLDENRLVQLQNAIVDQRFAATTFRNFQNYIGQTLPGYVDLIHYICPPPELLPSLMKGLSATAANTAGIYPEARAAIVAFSFVFIHPFEDGNGRLHRFIIHDILVQEGIVPHGLLIPVSAHILNNLREYDTTLEKYSKPLMQRIRYEKKDDGELSIMNADEVEGYFRYPDLTDQCIYLIQTIHATLEQDMPDELQFIQRYDEVKKAFQDIIDMPDKNINLMITFLHQNKGIFPKRRRDQFASLTDEEIIRMQSKYREIFEMEIEN